MSALLAGPDAVDVITSSEGCTLVAFLDTLAKPPVPTIGFGCTGPNVRMGMKITKQEAWKMLYDRLHAEFEPGVNAAIGNATTTQYQFDAMISLAWNIGVGAFKTSEVLKHHVVGGYQEAADSFRNWISSGGVVRSGLVKRRERERLLYLNGKVHTVAEIQAKLNTMGHILTVDGDAGPKTCNAIYEALEDLERHISSGS